MKKIALVACLLLLTAHTTYAHHAIDMFSWMKPIERVINSPTEHIVYEDEDALLQASEIVVEAKWTKARKTKESERGSVYTISQIKIEKWVKGKTARKIVIVEPAYVLDGVYYQFDGHTFLEADKTYRFYLTTVKGRYSPINPTQGIQPL